jgi:hypothetical protein
MSNEQLAELTQPQRDRLAFVELRVRFIGEIRRQDLVARFGIQSAAASRDLALYKELAPGNIDYDSKAKTYVLGPDFRAVFDFPPERVLSWLTQGFGDGEPMRLKAWVACESPSRLTHPDLDVLASVTRAIHQECPLAIEYHSIANGQAERQIVPFALIDNGLRWHVRAFDRLRMKLRAATAGYILRKWSVDCSPDHSLRGHEFRLWLKDPLALYGVKNALLAPGYRSPDKNKGEP